MKQMEHVKHSKPIRHRQGQLTGFLFILPSLLGVAVFLLFPFLDVLRRSFFTAVGGRFVFLENYRLLFENTAFRLALGNTLRFMLLCIPLLVALSLLLALLVSAWPGERVPHLYKTTFLLPLAVPVASVALLWRVLFHQNGLINGGAVRLGLLEAAGAIDYMNSDWAFWVLVGSYLWKNLGYDMILWLAGLAGIPKDQYEAARVDGASGGSLFLYITLPQLLPTLFTISVLSFLNAFRVFREAYLVAGSYPHSSMYLLQHLLGNWFVDLDMDKLCAAASLLALSIFLLILLLQKSWEREDLA